MTVKLKHSKRQRKVRCLIDCGSQIYFITKECQNYNELYSFEQEVHTYIGKQKKCLKNVYWNQIKE